MKRFLKKKRNLHNSNIKQTTDELDGLAQRATIDKEEEDYDDMESWFKHKNSSKKHAKRTNIMLGDVSNIKLIVIIIGLFIMYHVFYPESSLRVCINTQMDINKYKKEIEIIDYELKQDCVIINGIRNNKTFLIKYAREHLYLSEKNEDIYIIEH